MYGNYIQNTKACDCFICLAFSIDLVDVMSDITVEAQERQCRANHFRDSKNISML